MLGENSLILIAVLANSFLINGAKVKIEKVDLEQFDAEYLKVTTNIRKDGDDDVIDIDADIIKDLGSENIFLQIHIEKEIEGNMRTLYKSELIDRCHFVDNQDKYPQVRMLVEDLKKYGNMMQPCPIKQGKYYTKGFKFEPKEEFIHLLTAGKYNVHFALFKKIGETMKELYGIKLLAIVE